MPKTPHPHRPHWISTRVSVGERVTIRAKARVAGLTLSDYLRRAALKKTVRARRSRATQDLVYHLTKIGTNLNQLARAANTARQIVAPELLEEAVARLRAVLDEIME